MRTWRPLEALAERIEQAEGLDRPAAAVSKIAAKALPSGPVEDALSGTPLGHPLHPALVALPIGAWTSSALFDVLGDRAGAQRLVGLGCLAAVPAAASGAAEWLSTEGAEKRVGLVHALVNDLALTAYALSWRARRRGAHGRGMTLSVLGAGLLTAGGWLGGHLAYALGVGVDTTAFQQLPQDWTDAGAESELPGDGETALALAADIPLLISRRGDTITAMLDRCTHRGGPLHEGEVQDGCVRCPWHGSAFALADGSVAAGPASRPQPMLETRVQDGRLQVRRVESRALRTNPVGS